MCGGFPQCTEVSRVKGNAEEEGGAGVRVERFGFLWVAYFKRFGLFGGGVFGSVSPVVALGYGAASVFNKASICDVLVSEQGRV